jgi:hypothetical protein
MKTHHYVILFLAAIAGCSSLPYQDDVGFSNSSQANSPEFPVYVDGHLCKDDVGNPGVCSKRIKSTDTITFHIDPQQYAYNLDISCETPVTIPPSISVPKNSPVDFTMTAPWALNNFVCEGEIFPEDRTQPLSAKWEIRVSLDDAPNAVTNSDLLTVNNQDCHDMDGGEGFCSLRTGSASPVVFHVNPQTFPYSLTVLCSTPVVASLTTPVLVAAGDPVDFSIAPPFPIESFVCVGEMTPDDPTLSKLRWDVRAVVVDKNYVHRESISFSTQGKDTYMVMGEYARTSWVFDGTSWKSYSKATMVKISNPAIVKSWSESYSMRYNYLNMDTPVVEGK